MHSYHFKSIDGLEIMWEPHIDGTQMEPHIDGTSQEAHNTPWMMKIYGIFYRKMSLTT